MSPGAAAKPAIDDEPLQHLLQDALPALRRFVGKLCGDGPDADDVLQETLAKVWRLRHAYDPAGNGLGWLCQAAFRIHCDLRARRRRQPEPRDDLHAAEAPAKACRTELQDELRHRLACLGELERTLLVGFHQGGLSLQELAERHGLPPNTVKSHLHRARRRLARAPEHRP